MNTGQLRELALEFAELNPALAPLLNAPMTDPDVERLLDAVAFQNSLLRRKIKNDFPELVCSLTNLILPHYLRPIPASTIVEFKPKHLSETVTIPAGTQIGSAPVDGTSTLFRTISDLEVHPLEIRDCEIVQANGHAAEIRLSFELNSIALSQWKPKSLRMFLSGDRPSATELYMLLRMNLKRIVITGSGEGPGEAIPPEFLKPAGFDEEEVLIPYPTHAFPGYRLLQEYFYAPEKLMFLEITGFERWKNRGNGGSFTIAFVFEKLTARLPRIGRSSFALNAVPAVNLFSHDADPVYMDHRASSYLIRPSGPDPSHCRVFSIDYVTGFSRKTGMERTYAPFELFGFESRDEPVYHAKPDISRTGHGIDVHLSVAFPSGLDFPDAETLSIGLTCTNGSLADNLRIGDICIPVFPIPAEVTASNITPVNPAVAPPLGKDFLWRLTCHLYLNHSSLGRTERLRTLLQLYLFQKNEAGGPAAANFKRIEGIEDVSVAPSECKVSGISMRGTEIRLKVRQDHFAGEGDLFLFGTVIDRFFREYASINSFTTLVIDETLRGRSRQWPIRQQ